MNAEYVILVAEDDSELGTMEKMQAHREGALHRAFSVFIFNTSGELLLHRRSLQKYHSAGLWTNTCCSHPRPGEATESAAHRRLLEEMGLSSELRHLFSFHYEVAFDNGLIEHELDHVFIGFSDALPEINPEEVSEYKYICPDELTEWIHNEPESFTPWFRICLPNVLTELNRIA